MGCSRCWVRCRRGIRLCILVGEEQLEREVGPQRLRQDREERRQHVWRCFFRQLSSCLKQPTKLASIPVLRPASLMASANPVLLRASESGVKIFSCCSASSLLAAPPHFLSGLHWSTMSTTPASALLHAENPCVHFFLLLVTALFAAVMLQDLTLSRLVLVRLPKQLQASASGKDGLRHLSTSVKRAFPAS